MRGIFIFVLKVLVSYPIRSILNKQYLLNGMVEDKDAEAQQPSIAANRQQTCKLTNLICLQTISLKDIFNSLSPKKSSEMNQISNKDNTARNRLNNLCFTLLFTIQQSKLPDRTKAVLVYPKWKKEISIYQKTIAQYQCSQPFPNTCKRSSNINQLESYNPITPSQFGFRSSHSISTALALKLEDVGVTGSA